MTPQQFEEELLKVAEIQRKAGWGEHSINLYAIEQREMNEGSMESTLMIGAGLACDNTRFGVPNPPRQESPDSVSHGGDCSTELNTGNEQQDELSQLRAVLMDVYVDSGFRNLFDGLQERIERLVNR